MSLVGRVFGWFVLPSLVALCMSLLTVVTLTQAASAAAFTAAADDVDPVPSNPLPEAAVPADPAEQWRVLPGSGDNLPEGGSAVVAPIASWSEVPGVPVEVRESAEATDLDAVEAGEDEVVDPITPSVDAPSVLVELEVPENPAEAPLLIDLQQTATDTATTGEPSPSEVETLTPTDESTASPEPDAEESLATESVSQAVEVALDYSDFAYLFGGGWADRLQVTAYPDCYLTTPEVDGCSDGLVIPSVNDPATGTLAFTSVDLAGDAAVDVEGVPRQESWTDSVILGLGMNRPWNASEGV